MFRVVGQMSFWPNESMANKSKQTTITTTLTKAVATTTRNIKMNYVQLWAYLNCRLSIFYEHNLSKLR